MTGLVIRGFEDFQRRRKSPAAFCTQGHQERGSSGQLPPVFLVLGGGQFLLSEELSSCFPTSKLIPSILPTCLCCTSFHFLCSSSLPGVEEGGSRGSYQIFFCLNNLFQSCKDIYYLLYCCLVTKSCPILCGPMN